MRYRVGTWVKYGCLRVVEAVGYGLSAAKEKTSIACIFSPWNTCAHRLYSTEQTVPACLQRSPNVGRGAARRQVRRDGTNFEAVDGFFWDELRDFGWVDAPGIK